LLKFLIKKTEIYLLEGTCKHSNKLVIAYFGSLTTYMMDNIIWRIPI